MKRLFALLFSLLPPGVHAQWAAHNLINFEPGDNLYPIAVSIDTVHYHHNIWQVGKPAKTVFTAAETTPNAIVTDTVHPYPVSDTSVFVLRVPAWIPDFPGSAHIGPMYHMQFSYQLNSDSNSIARLEISPDRGGHWVNIRDSFPADFGLDASSESISQTTGTWAHYGVTVTPGTYVMGDTFLFRYTFISDTAFANKDGWMIDDIFLEFAFEAVPQVRNDQLITVYPNPSHGDIYLHALTAMEGTLHVYNMQGKEMYFTERMPANDVLHLPLPGGSYVLKYETETTYCVKQIVIVK